MPQHDSEFPIVVFGDSPELADRLASLVVEGIKTATCSAYEEDKPLPNVGDKIAVADSKATPLCIIRIEAVRIISFDQIDAEFAKAEGEGDRSLAYWRKEHQAFFERNGGFDPSMPLVCETFRVIHRF